MAKLKLTAVISQHVEANGRGQPAVCAARFVDLGGKFVERAVVKRCYLAKGVPEIIFQ